MGPSRKANIVLVVFGFVAVVWTALAQETSSGGGVAVQGVVQSNRTPLPGVVVIALNPATSAVVSAVTDVNGQYVLKVSGTGKYRLTASMTAFGSLNRDVEIADPSKPFTSNFELTLQSRVQRAAAEAARQASGPQGAGPVDATEALNGDLETSRAFVAPDLALPGMSTDSATESVAVAGNTAAPAFGGLFDPTRLAQLGGFDGFGGPGAISGLGPAAAAGGGPGAGPGGGPGGGAGGGRGAPGGGPGGRGGAVGGAAGAGRGGFALGGQRGRGNVNRPQINFGYTLADSILDAAPYSLTGVAADKPGYVQNQFNATAGGPLAIPHLLSGQNNNFNVTYNGGRSRTPYDIFSTVPTLAERSGDFSQTLKRNGPLSGDPVQVVDPQTGLPFSNTQIPAAMISPAAAGLLAYIPLPNTPGDTQNFHYSTSNKNNSDTLNIRLAHTFPSANQPGQRGQRGGGGGGGARGGGGGRGGRGSSISAGIQFQSRDSVTNNPFPTIGGSNQTSGFSVPLQFSRTFGPIPVNLRFTYSRNKTVASNLFTSTQDVAGNLGIHGVSSDPFDWGLPTLSFTNFSGLNDPKPSARNNQSYQIGESFVLIHRRHSMNFGFDWSRNTLDSHASGNARGTFTFTGASSGYDFADFLLGLPQLTSVQYGSNNFHFKANSWDFFAQDDWRVRPNLTIQLGLRYEYTSPFSERDNRIVNLDVAPDFSAVAPVRPGDVGPFSGEFPSTLVNPDRNNFGPRIGIAWRAPAAFIVRSGYGINYNNSTYNSMVQQFALQPPFTFTQTNVASAAFPLTLADGFPALPSTTVTNNFGVERDYRIGYAQIWNLNVQRNIPWRLTMSLDYSGTKGTGLNLVQAPNRTATGVRIAGVQPFQWETSAGNSISHVGSLQLNRRLQSGLSLGGTYTWSKCIDDVPNGGLGTGSVAQDAFNIVAERAVCNTDQRQRLNGNFVYELPFGTNKSLLSGDGLAATLFGDWQLNGTYSFGSGMPFTPTVIGSTGDLSSGTTGTLRADATGLPVSLSDPSAAQWFNTAAFAVPAAGTYGSAGRNTIRGPASKNLDMSLNKTIRMSGNRGIDVRLQATNVLNMVQYRSINTTVNSSSFGKVTAAAGMRKVQFVLRYRF